MAQQSAAAQGIAPEIVLVDEAARAIVSKKAEGGSFGAALAHPAVRPLALKNLAETLGRLHAIPAPHMPPFEPTFGETAWDEQKRRDGFPVWARALEVHITAGNAVFEHDPRRVFSHNDVNPANLIWDGTQVWLVDWERASLAHPYIDLAIFALFMNLPDDVALGLLAVQEASDISPTQHLSFIALLNYARAVYGAIFLRLVPDLTQVKFQTRAATPTLGECYVRLSKGELNLRTPEGQAMFAAAILRQATV